MKRVTLFSILTLLSIALAGELATLHGVLSSPDSVQECSVQETSPGVQINPDLACNQRPPDPNVSELGIERTPCLTGCPAYTFIIQSDGRFRYVGDSGVERIGVFTGTVDQGRLRQVRRFAEELDVFSLPDTFRGGLDNPTTYVLVTAENRTKVISNSGQGSPAGLWALEQLIDDLLEFATWDDF